MLGRLKFNIETLVEEILDQLPKSVWSSKTTTFLDPAIGGGQFVSAIERRLRLADHSDENIASRVFGFEDNQMRINFAVNKHKLKGTYTAKKFIEEKNDMKFDVIVGNPPYQDGTKEGGQNKIYNQFAKKSLELLSDNGVLAFITPTSVCKKSKRFSIANIDGLKQVDFTANNYFDVGAKICSWIVEKTYVGKVKVKFDNGEELVDQHVPIVDYSVVTKEFSELYQSIRNITKDMNFRMFKHNSIDMSNCRSSEQDEKYCYPIYKLNSDGSKTICQYNSVKPKLHSKRSFTVAISKKFDVSMTAVDEFDYDMTHVSVEVENDQQVENIKSFIFSDYFRKHVDTWKLYDGYGWNYALLYLPPFDKNKHWTNEEVKEFIESFYDRK